MEFYKNATELRCALSGFVMQEKYIPKKWRPILAYPTVNLLNTMMEHIIAANGIYPYSGGKLDHELLHRRKELQAQAVADCEALFDRLQFIICGALGGLLGLAAMYINVPDFPANDPLTALAVGIVSGLAATGADQVIKQIGKDN